MVELNVTTTIHAPIERCFDLSRSIEVHLLGTEETRERAIGGVTTGLIGMGEFVRWRATHFGIRQNLASRITAYDRPTYFRDEMFEGAFRSMRHDHWFEAIDANEASIMRDRFVFEAPVPVLGLLAEQLVLKRYMTRFLLHRNRILKQVAESQEWQQFLTTSR